MVCNKLLPKASLCVLFLIPIEDFRAGNGMPSSHSAFTPNAQVSQRVYRLLSVIKIIIIIQDEQQFNRKLHQRPQEYSLAGQEERALKRPRLMQDNVDTDNTSQPSEQSLVRIIWLF